MTQPVQRQKLSDLVVEEIKRWVVTGQLGPGDRLPQESELMQRFGVSKGTIRESLKSLEVQGLVRISTGPRGGASIARVEYDKTAELLGNFFYFQQLDAPKIYELRRIVEPEMAAAAVGHLTEEQFARLEQSIHCCLQEPEDPEERRRQRIEELEFHNILAEACPNALLSFVCRFINRLLADLVVYKKMYVPKQKRIARENHNAHERLLAAYREDDREAVHRIMRDHMEECAVHIIELEAVVKSRFLGGNDDRPARTLAR